MVPVHRYKEILMNLLKRDISPLVDEAWAEIDSRAEEILSANLTARKFLKVTGPKGWDYGAVPTGRLDLKDTGTPGEVHYGLYSFKPLLETRTNFDLDIWELDNIVRGAKDVDLDPLENAARKSALFEEHAVYRGLEQAGISGLSGGSSHEEVAFGRGNAEDLSSAVSRAVSVLKDASVPSSYMMIASPQIWQTVMAYTKGYPLRKHMEELLENGTLVYSPSAEGAYIVPVDSDDLELTIGQDFATGFERREAETVKLFITESFTFRILNPDVIVRLTEQ